MSDNLNEQQFAKYSARKVPHPIHEYEYEPLPASMERHAPGEYQPTLPGMEHMLEGEQTSTQVFFKHPNQVDPETAQVKGSAWGHLTRNYNPVYEQRQARSLRPTQDWVDDKYINSAPKPPPGLGYWHEGRPLVERLNGTTVVHDGHHRAVREIMAGKKQVDVARFGGSKKEWTW